MVGHPERDSGSRVMGADMLVYTLKLPEDEPEWAAAEKFINALDMDSIEHADLPYETAQEARSALLEHLRQIRRAVDQGHREGAVCRFDAPGEWLITGGMSDGGYPTELAESIDALKNSGAARAAGLGSVMDRNHYIDPPT